MGKYIVTIKTTIRKDFVFEANSEVDASFIAKDSFTKVLENGQIQFEPLNVKVVKKETKILDTFNGHNEKLVEVINILWNKESCGKSLNLIIKSLVLRDLEEFEDKMFEGIEEEKCWDLVEWCDNNFEDCAYNYLHRCADDGDLETIIEFCRYWEKTPCGKTRWLTIKGWVE